MTEVEEKLAQRFGWFAPDTEILGVETRSLSLRSMEAVEIMGLKLLKPEMDLAPVEEMGQLQAYVWLHSEEPKVIARALWDESWRSLLEYEETNEIAMLEVLREWREIRQRILFLLEATAIQIRPKPKAAGAKESPLPSYVVHPSRLAHRLYLAQRDSGMDREAAGWELPIWEANLLYHAAMRWEGQHTARGVANLLPKESMEDFDLPEFAEEGHE